MPIKALITDTKVFDVTLKLNTRKFIDSVIGNFFVLLRGRLSINSIIMVNAIGNAISNVKLQAAHIADTSNALGCVPGHGVAAIDGLSHSA